MVDRELNQLPTHNTGGKPAQSRAYTQHIVHITEAEIQGGRGVLRHPQSYLRRGRAPPKIWRIRAFDYKGQSMAKRQATLLSSWLQRRSGKNTALSG